MKKHIFIYILLLQFTLANAQLSGDYLIGASQPSPFNTISSAVNELNTVGVSGAVTFLLTDPLYEETGIELKNIQGTSTANTITIRPANGINAEIKGDGEYIFGIDRCSHLTFEGQSPNNTGSLTITSTDSLTQSNVFKITTDQYSNNKMRNIHILNCNINAAPPVELNQDKSNRTVGINFQRIGEADSIVFHNNNFTGGNTIITIFSFSNRFNKIKITNNNFNLAGAITIFSTYGSTNDSIIFENNTLKNMYVGDKGGNHIGWSPVNGILSITSHNNFSIQNNLFDNVIYQFLKSKDKPVNLFNFMNSTNAIIANNVFQRITNEDDYPRVNVLDIEVNQNLKFYHNSIFIHNGSGHFTRNNVSYNGIYLRNNSNVEIKNNILVMIDNLNSLANSFAQIYNFETANDINTLQSDHNIYYVNSHTQDYFYSVSTTNNDFNQWQTAYPTQDQNSYWEEPKFVFFLNDLHLSTNCDRGTPIPQVPTDYDGIVRDPVTPDIGAYEFILGIICDNNACAFDDVTFEFSSPPNVKSVLWNFGDSKSSTEQKPTHAYSTAGTYTVTLTVTYMNNSTQTFSKEIKIINKPTKPIIYHD